MFLSWIIDPAGHIIWTAKWPKNKGIVLDTPTIIWGLIVGVSFLAALTALKPMLSPRKKLALESAGNCFFLFDGKELNSASASAHELLQKSPNGKDAYEQLLGLFDNSEFIERMEALTSQGIAFSQMINGIEDQLLEINGQPIGGTVRIEIRIAGTNARKVIETQNELNELRTKCQMLNEIVDSAPIHVARFSSRGELIWQNGAFKDIFLTDKTAHTQLKRAGSQRICVEDTQKGDHWFSVKRSDKSDEHNTIYATPIDTLVSAEKSLANFVSTLTETFAHLTTGLAIFDSNGRLSLFNPALGDLTGIDPTRLISQPSIRDFLELLRELRMVPEQRDFSAWRQTITQLERGSREGSYQADWTLPSGRVFRVIGRPHPNGAIALIFEDISSTVTLERRYRDEIELGQAALDRISDAVAIFDTGGSLVFANNAFDDMWQIDSMTTLEAPNIAQMARRWSETSLPTPIWDRLRSFVTSDQSRTSWQAEVTTKSGQHLQGHFSPLPNGSTLTVFSRHLDTNQTLNLNGEGSALLVAKSTRDALLTILPDSLKLSGTEEKKGKSETISLLQSISEIPQADTRNGISTLRKELQKFATARAVKLEIGDWCWSETDAPSAPIPTLLWTFLLAAIETKRHDDAVFDLKLSATRNTDGIKLTAHRVGLLEDPDGLAMRYLISLADRLSDSHVITYATDQMQLEFSTSNTASRLPLREVKAS